MTESDWSAESGRRADADRVIEEIRRVLKREGVAIDPDDRRFLDWSDPEEREFVRRKFDEFDEPVLPGFGELGEGRTARDDCGEPHPFVCDSCGNPVEFGRTCAQSVCSRCGVAWVRDTAINKTAKNRRIRKEKDWHTPDDEHQKFHHQVISAPLSWYYDLAKAGLSLDEAQDVTKEVVKIILDEMRAQGLLARHSYRGVNDDGTIKTETDDRGAWKERLNSGRDFYGDVRDELAWRPHYHCVVISDWLKGGGEENDHFTERIEEETGWLIHRIVGRDGKRSVKNDGQMARVSTYTISHADIDVNLNGHNRSAVWEVGSFEGDIVKSSSRFTASPTDKQWADRVVRHASWDVLGLQSGTTECGADLPPVDDPDALAAKIIEELYPQHERPAHREIDTGGVLHQVSKGNISVQVSTTSGGGGDVTVLDSSGNAVGPDGWPTNLPDTPGSMTFDGADAPPATTVDAVEVAADDDCERGSDHEHDHDRRDEDDDQDDRECDGTLIPLEEARQRGLLEDDDWLDEAPFAADALEVDVEWRDDLDPWRTTSPGNSIGAG